MVINFNFKRVFFALILLILLPIVVVAYDPLEAEQFYLDKINADQAWAITTGENDLVVAVLDTGIDLDHPDIAENIWQNAAEINNDGLDNDNNGFIDDFNGYNFVYDIGDPQPYLEDGFVPDAVEHGTFVAGIISAIHDNNIAVKGITDKVKIMPLIVLDAYGYGASDHVAQAINYAIDNGADVINLSFGGYENNDNLKLAILRAYSNDIPIIAAAGNNATDLAMEEDQIYPICYDANWTKNALIGVASLNDENQLSDFSNYGGNCVDICAPGEKIVGIVYQDIDDFRLQKLTRNDFNGTSFATAMVSGTVALMKSINKYLTVDQINSLLRQSSVNIDFRNNEFRDQLGYGLLDTYKAVRLTMENYQVENDYKIFVSADEQILSAVKVFDPQLVLQSEVSAFDESFAGLNISSADINFDQKKEIIVGATAGNMPFVRAFDENEILLNSFLAYEADFVGGVKATAGDLNNDGKIEFVTVPQSNRSARIRIFNDQGKVQKEFLAFDEKFISGMSLAVGNVLGDDKLEIAVGAPFGDRPIVKIFDDQGNLLKTIEAFVSSFTGGVNLGLANLDGQGYDEIICGAGIGGGPHVRVFDSQGVEQASFFAYNENFRGGVRVSALDINNDNIMEIITVPGKTGGPHLKIFNLQGYLMDEIFVYSAGYTGGLQVAVNY